MRKTKRRSVRPFVPVIVSTGGGGITLPLFPEKKQDMYCSSNIVDEIIMNSVDIPPGVYNPKPVQSYAAEDTLDLNLELASRFQMIIWNKKRKRVVDNVQVVVVPAPAVPCIEEFPVMLKAIESFNGSRPEFIYAKKLEDSDVRQDQNRVFLTKKLLDGLISFLDEAEVTALYDEGRALKVLGVDEEGRSYNLELKWWPSLKMTVICSDWKKMVAANNAGEGNYVHIWGFRLLDQDGKLGFAIVFQK